jgi:Nif-specific regulatory protein
MNSSAEQTQMRLECLVELNQLLMSTVEPDALLRAIHESCMRLFSVEACSIALIDETDRKLVIAFSKGGAKVEGFRLELGQGIVGAVAQTGEGVICNDVSQNTRFFCDIDKKTGFTTRSVLCAPLKQRGQLIGAIELLNTNNPNGFTQEDLQLLTAFGALASTAINCARVFASMRNANLAFQEGIQDRYGCIIGKSDAFQAALRLARSVASTNTTVLLLGESGTGKEVIAHAIHQESPRAAQPFIAVNCVALTEELIESELFGHEKGAFTGAIAQKKGKFELADGGTIFLDEIGDLTPRVQAKLLRVLQEKEFQRVGGTKDIHVDVRIIAATNRNLSEAVQSGAFRKDLYYRLNVVPIMLPPLRDRKDDIPELIRYFIECSCREVKRPQLGIDQSAMDMLMSHDWPGNVRELHNVIERAVVLCPGPNITEFDLPPEIRRKAGHLEDDTAQGQAFEEPQPTAEALDHFKRLLIQKTLQSVDGDQTKAAKILGLQRSNLSRLMKRLGLR